MGLGTTIYNTALAGSVWIYRKTGGRIGSQRGKVILLTTTGRKTGLARTKPLVGITDGNRVLVAASAGGSERNPAWYHNLVANPLVKVEQGRDIFNMIARVAGPGERPGLWNTFVERAPQFARYERRTGREIPVVILEPAG